MSTAAAPQQNTPVKFCIDQNHTPEVFSEMALAWAVDQGLLDWEMDHETGETTYYPMVEIHEVEVTSDCRCKRVCRAVRLARIRLKALLRRR